MRSRGEQFGHSAAGRGGVMTLAAVTVVLVAGATLQAQTATAVVRHLGLRHHHVQSAAETRAVAQLMQCLADAAKRLNPNAGKLGTAALPVIDDGTDFGQIARERAIVDCHRIPAVPDTLLAHLIDLPPPAAQR